MLLLPEGHAAHRVVGAIGPPIGGARARRLPPTLHERFLSRSLPHIHGEFPRPSPESGRDVMISGQEWGGASPFRATGLVVH
jgi:hypothetical protein